MCYAPSAVAVRNDTRHAIDWEAEEGYRAFDAVVGSVFRFTVLATRGDTVDTELTERNDFLDALGIPLVRARWRYVVRRGLIAEEHHLVADSTFAGSIADSPRGPGPSAPPSGQPSAARADWPALTAGAPGP
jgi:hypothetical protein